MAEGDTRAVPAGLHRLVAHMAWADERMLAACPPEALAEVQRVLSHILAAEHIWLRRLQGRPPEHPVWPELNPAQLQALAAANASGYAALLADAPDPTTLVAYQNSRGAPFETAWGDIVTHVVLHGSYHRGQVAQTLRRLGADPASTDFIAFARAPEL